jgi:hypothetical protein
MASAIEMTSRPQLFASVMGFTNKPKPERNPNDSNRSRQALVIRKPLEARLLSAFVLFT